MVRLVPVALLVPALFGADWSAKSAADYMDSRQKLWFAWPTAKGPGGPCISCHTGLAYLMARPDLRKKLGEAGPTEWEIGLHDAMKGRVLGSAEKPAIQISVETVFLSALDAMEDSKSGKLRPETEQVLAKLWERQLKDGPLKGSWPWYSLNLDPWETEASPFFAGSLAALAAGVAPAYVPPSENFAALKEFLGSHREGQPLQNRLLLLWASMRVPDLVSKSQREALLKEVWAKQESDGGWSMASLGGWNVHPDAPLQPGSNGYATAFTAFVLERAGISHRDAHLKKALDWLSAHQDPAGFWEAQSLNKKFPADSMEIRFMRDAATGYASMALVGASR
jgi:hypothetical protein